jgi:hypothetical protein
MHPVRWLFHRGTLVVLAVSLFAPLAAHAQSVTGQATAVLATIAGITTALGSTGSLSGITDALGSSAVSGSIPLVGAVENVEAATISSVTTGASPDEVSSMASVANLAFTLAGSPISADFILASVRAPAGAAPQASSIISGLAVAGVPVTPSGAQNQLISAAGLSIVLNEVQTAASGTTVNALHITSPDGLINVVVGSATAGLQAASSPLPLPLGL